MEGSENVNSNLSFSEKSEQDLYDDSLRRKGVRSVYLGTYNSQSDIEPFPVTWKLLLRANIIG